LGIVLSQVNGHGKMIRRIKNGQSTLEYVILLAVVVGAIVAAAAAFSPQVQAAYDMMVSNP